MKTLQSYRWTAGSIARKSVAAAVLGISFVSSANAANIVLSDGNSTVTLNPTSTAGVEGWTINGVNQLDQEWFWFRAGNSSGQSALNSLGTPTITTLDTKGDGKTDDVKLVYGSSTGLQITINYLLSGGSLASSSADLTDTIKINNGASSSLALEFFQYANFELGDSTIGQTVAITNGNTATVSGDGGQAQTVVSPVPSEYAASNAPTLLNAISNSTTKETLPDTVSAPAGNPEFAFEWDTNVAMCNTYVITGDTIIQAPPQSVPVPEPMNGAFAVTGAGALLLKRARRRPRRKWAM